MCLSLCACDEKTSLEQRLDDAKATTKALEEAAQKAEDRYDQLLDDIEAYENAKAKLDQFK